MTTSPPAAHLSPMLPPFGGEALPVGVLAAIGVYSLLILLQFGVSAIQFLAALGTLATGQVSPALGLLVEAFWNGAIGLFFGLVTYWLYRGKRAGYDWGLGSAVLNIMLSGGLLAYNLGANNGFAAFINLVTIMLNVAAALLLYGNRIYFPRTTSGMPVPSPTPAAVVAPPTQQRPAGLARPTAPPAKPLPEPAMIDQAIRHYDASVSYYQQGQYDKSELAIKRALELDPDDPRFYGQYCLLCYHLERYDAGIDLGKKAVHFIEGRTLPPHEIASIYNNYSLCLWKRGRVEDALQYIAKALALSDDPLFKQNQEQYRRTAFQSAAG